MKNEKPLISVARCRYSRISAQKVRLVINEIRGKAVLQAINILNFTNKKSSKIVKQVLLSAVANAKNNYSLESKDLKIIKIFADVGPSFKRVMPRAKGRADNILKRTSHITVMLSNI